MNEYVDILRPEYIALYFYFIAHIIQKLHISVSGSCFWHEEIFMLKIEINHNDSLFVLTVNSKTAKVKVTDFDSTDALAETSEALLKRRACFSAGACDAFNLASLFCLFPSNPVTTLKPRRIFYLESLV